MSTRTVNRYQYTGNESSTDSAQECNPPMMSLALIPLSMTSFNRFTASCESFPRRQTTKTEKNKTLDQSQNPLSSSNKSSILGFPFDFKFSTMLGNVLSLRMSLMGMFSEFGIRQMSNSFEVRQSIKRCCSGSSTIAWYSLAVIRSDRSKIFKLESLSDAFIPQNCS